MPTPSRNSNWLVVVMAGAFLCTAAVCWFLTPIAPRRETAPSAPVQPTLSGRYYQGDHLGHNWNLDLRDDRTFSCSWFGCLGDYGSTHGTWLQDGDRILTTTLKSDGLFVEHPIGNMTVVKHNGEARLLRDEDAERARELDTELLEELDVFVYFVRAADSP